MRTPVGQQVYPPVPEGFYWASGTLFWRVQGGDVVARVLGTQDAYNGRRRVQAAVVSLIVGSQQMARVAIPSEPLSRELEVLAPHWAALRILRDGTRRAWRAVPIPSGPLVDTARELNGG
ncbi:hypothetical protein ACWEOX_28020 [Streptomyces sp. NPDC004314]